MLALGSSQPNGNSVVGIYQLVDIDDAIVLTTDGVLADAEIVLTRFRHNQGSFAIRVSRVGQNLYRVEGTILYIRTKYCHTYAYNQYAVLTINSSFGYVIGTLTFE